ncbi:MAG: glycosyltransferase [Pseudomonadota bacterium]
MKTVLHDVGVWLPRTKTWLYNQIVSLNPDWTAWAIANRSENLDEFPFENLYVLRDRKGKLWWFLQMALRRARITAHAPSILRFSKEREPAVLHSHFGTTGWMNLRLARTLGAKHVVTFYGFDVTLTPRLKNWRSRYLQMFDEVDRVLCEGPHMADEIHALGCPREKLTVQRLGVDVGSLPFRTRKPGDGPIRFLMAGSFREKKGLPDGLLALARLHARQGLPDWQLTIAGGAGSSEEGAAIEQQLKTIASDHAIEDRVRYAGFVQHSELIALGQSHDVFLCPSVRASNGDTEGGAPVVMIEMAALGLPVLGTTHCDMPYTLGELNRSMLVAEKDVDALSLAVQTLVEAPQLWPQIGEQNRHHCETSFDAFKQGQSLSAIYDQLLA